MAQTAFRLLWGCNPAKWDTTTLYAPGLFRTLRNVAVEPSGGYLPVGATWDSGAITFSGNSPADTFGPDELVGTYDYAAKWPRFIPDSLHWAVGSRFWMDANPSEVTPIYLVLNQEGFCQMSLCIDTSGHLSAWRGLPDVGLNPNNLELWNSGVALDTGVWHRLGFWGLVASVNGWFDVYQNGQHLTFTAGKITHIHAIIPWTGIGFGGTSDMKHSHLYIGCGIPETVQNFQRRGSFLSIPGLPSADGSYTAWASNVATRYQALDEAPPDDGTTRIASDTVGAIYTVERESLTGTRGILGIQQTARYMRPDDTAYALRQCVTVDDVVYPATTLAADAAEVWAFDQPEVLLVDPSNSLPFTRARLNERIEWGGIVHGSP